MLDVSFYKDKKVLITGHTGFKGSWMCQLLIMAGAKVTGYALEAPTDPSLFEMCHLADHMQSVIGDVRDLDHMKKVFDEVQPEIVIHMAAQPIVRESYKNPVYTYETNVMGTVNVLECVRLTSSVKSFLNVTTDKVYLNKEWEWGYRENEELNFAVDRIVPDCIRSAEKKEDIIVRNPFSTRPYEHVLEPVVAYLMIAKAQYEDKKYAGNYNVGPDETDCWTTGNLVTLFCEKWNRATGDSIKWIDRYDGGPHEANFLKLDCSKLKRTFGWKPRWNVETTMEKIVEWSHIYLQHGDVADCMKRQIEEFITE